MMPPDCGGPGASAPSPGERDRTGEPTPRRSDGQQPPMSDLILSELPRIARQASTEQILSRIRARTTVGGPAGAELVRADRDRG